MQNMILLEYIRKPPLHCIEANNNGPKLLEPPALIRGYIGNDSSSKRRSSLSRQGWSLLGPATRVWRGGVDMVNSTVSQMKDGLTKEQRLADSKKEEQRQILRVRMRNAVTRKQWQTAAKELDILDDNEAWKHDLNTSEFDVALIEARLKQLDEARINCDISAMLHLVRTALARDLGGMGNIRLYKHSHIGTKDLIERYIDSTLSTIRSLVEMSKYNLPNGIETKDILEQVVYTRQAFGRSALLLSGGATFGMNHVGVLKALFEAKLLPRIISGASAGSIVCAVLCTRTDEEIPHVLEAFPFGDLAVFEENGKEDGVLERVRRLLTQGAWIDIKHLTRVMQGLLGDMTFQEAYNRTRRILNICVSSASVYELPRLLNYVTSPNVLIWSAVAASCSVPLLFSAAQLLVKNPVTGQHIPWNPTPQRWIDGSVDNDLPMTRLAEMFNVNHFIVSQVNPHVVPFLIKDDVAITKSAQENDDGGPGWVYTLTNLAKDEALHRMYVLGELGIFPNLVSKCRSILSQKYSGDITILPEIRYEDFPRILKNPTSEFMVHACLSGERATWPRLSRIKNHCAVELELDSAVQHLRARVVFSPSQVDLRRMTTGSYKTVPKTGGRKRTGSGSSIRARIRNTDEIGTFNGEKKAMFRPPIRVANSAWALSKRSADLPGPQSAHVTPQQTPRARDTEVDPFNFILQTRQDLRFPFPEFSSAGETTHSPPSSDADVDSHTDDSSPDLEEAFGQRPAGLGLSYNPTTSKTDVIDFFSSSQPVRTGTDHVLATSPASSRSTVALAMTPKSKDGDWVSVAAPSSPETRYKRLFHPAPSQPKVPL